MELSGFEEINRWILIWDPQVQALKPKELRDAITVALKETMPHYS